MYLVPCMYVFMITLWLWLNAAGFTHAFPVQMDEWEKGIWIPRLRPIIISTHLFLIHQTISWQKYIFLQKLFRKGALNQVFIDHQFIISFVHINKDKPDFYVLLFYDKSLIVQCFGTFYTGFSPAFYCPWGSLPFRLLAVDLILLKVFIRNENINVQNRKSTCFTTRKGYVWTKYNSHRTYNTMEREALLILFKSSVWITGEGGDFSHRLLAQSCTKPSNGYQTCFFSPPLSDSCFEMSQSKILKCQRIWFKKRVNIGLISKLDQICFAFQNAKSTAVG